MKIYEPYVEERFEDLEVCINLGNSAEAVRIFLNKGTAFGSNHSTTQLSAKAITHLANNNLDSALDIGCGSGILTILLLKLGYKIVKSVDIDPFVIDEAKRNIMSNFEEFPRNLTLSLDEIGQINQKFDLVVANISRNFVYNNFKVITSLLRGKGYLIISGFNSDDKDKYLSIASKNDMDLVCEFKEKPWISLVFRKLSF
ncbi:MAG: 50S ribosomal protein L11 methyltransferase [Thermodesulfobacteriota bacterium]|nr:50S ribosomal protein L11 methyltransferase [Thermodesulfobacteriota bacterium]|tara:strand:- start:21956 stop:22555 length:600 start_codon:yes stop_codon:yes gene_type:complete